MTINIPCNEKCWGDITLKIGNKNQGYKKRKSNDIKKLCLRIKFIEEYPSIPPIFQLYYQNFEDLITDDLKLLKNQVEKKALKLSQGQEPMIFQICLFLEEEYEKINEVLTFYENMEKEKEERRSS